MGNLASSGTPRVSNCLLTDPSRSRHPHLPARRASSSASSTVRPGSHPPTRPGRRAPCARATRRGTQRQDPAHGSSRAGRGPEAHAALARAVGRLREVGRPLGHLAVVVAPGRASPRLAVPGRRRAYRRGSRVAVDSRARTMDVHGDPNPEISSAPQFGSYRLVRHMNAITLAVHANPPSIPAGMKSPRPEPSRSGYGHVISSV